MMSILVLAALGLCFGSFVNALVWRLHKQEKAKSKKARARYSIARGRSMCVHCWHTLAVRDLIPVFSWLLLRGRCHYCKKPISGHYPLVELLTAALFVLSYLWWPEPLEGAEVLRLGVWLVCLVGFMALTVYDLRWMLLPNRIIFPLIGLVAAAVVVETVALQSIQPVLTAGYGALFGGGIYYLLFQISGGRWIGGGDVKLGCLLGLLVGGPVNALLVLFFGSLLGTLVIVPLLLSQKISAKTHIPFGPFLIAAALITQLFGRRLIDWYLALPT